MEYLVAGLLLAAALTALNLLLTVAAVRRWRAHATAPPDGGHHGHDHGHGHGGGEPELGIAPGDRMPAFTATAADGTTVTAADLAGRPALLAFLSLECPGCDDSVPGFAEHARRVRDAGGLVLATVVGVDAAGSDLAAQLAGVADHVVPEFLDAPLGTAFGVRLYPGFAHYGPDGVATATSVGLDRLNAALAPSTP
ncbi:peroxiredoxin family protein [Actinomadura geliboluensis]|uniref:Redoxin domain-containing protein n=1 Tax=Actinomadura geliboluensis TaxID=882440 RepID=A0A5S4H8M6_9ACTN|nr:redoxin domain-containing protein [Actinomadura geliboluensis]TMR41114.1 redoxin domain-containing protein [Actinomadura geliboluensis]